MTNKIITIIFIFFSNIGFTHKTSRAIDLKKSVTAEELPDCGCLAKVINDAKWFHTTNAHLNIFSLGNNNQYS